MATANIEITIADSRIAAVRAHLMATFPDADTDESGAVSNAEGLAFIQDRCQRLVTTIVNEKAMPQAEENAPGLLEQAYQDLLTARAANEAAIAAARAAGTGA